MGGDSFLCSRQRGAAELEGAQFLWDQRVIRPIQAPAAHKAQPLVLASALSALVHPDKSREPKGGSTRYSDRARRRLAQWFWAATFTGYRPPDGELEIHRDELIAWAVEPSDAPISPEIVRRAVAPPAEEVAAWRFGSRHHRAITALLSRLDPCDLLTGERIAAQQAFEGRVDAHHLFPKRWATDGGRDFDVDVVVNGAVITGYTNRWIGKRAPSVYLAILQETVNGHRVLPTGGHEFPRWWPSFLPAGGRESPHQQIDCFVVC